MASVQDVSGRLVAADKITGTAVYNQDGERLGKIEDIMLDKLTGRTCYAVLRFGGFLGIGEKHYPLPWEKLSYNPIFGGFVVDIDRTRLSRSPGEPAG